jgi:hypothetical protein
VALASRFSRMLSFQIKDMEFTGLGKSAGICSDIQTPSRGHDFYCVFFMKYLSCIAPKCALLYYFTLSNARPFYSLAY